MNFRSIVGKIIILAGVIVVLYSAVLFVQNQLEEKNALSFSTDAASQLLEEIQEIEEIEDTEVYPDIDIESSAQVAGTISVDGNLYIGVLEIPSLNLVLPIQNEWSYTKLRNSPCAYETEPLIIAAHNYDAHFGRIWKLETGNQAIFTNAENQVFYYEVVEVEMLDGTDVLNMVETECDMTLFTCNYNDNTERVVVRLNRIDEE